jgi:hypothetical protein
MKSKFFTVRCGLFVGLRSVRRESLEAAVMRVLLSVAVMCMCACGGEDEMVSESTITTKSVQWVLDWSNCPGGKAVKGPSTECFKATYQLGQYVFCDTRHEGKCERYLRWNFDIMPELLSGEMLEDTTRGGCVLECVSHWMLMECIVKR